MEEYYFTNPKYEIKHIQLNGAKDILLRGLRYYIGEKAQWLQKYEDIAEWLTDNHCKGLFLSGDNGLGKTVICTKVIPAIFKYYLKFGFFYYDAIRLSECYKNAIDNYNLIVSREPIIIDDIGVESIGDNFGEKHDYFSEIVDDAEKRGRLLIITSNLTIDELTERYGRRTVDRLKAITHAIAIKGESLRGG